MSDIVLLANSEDMRVVAAAAIQYTGADIPIVITHTYEESQRLAVEYREKGCRMLIARGGHARAIRAANVGIPVMPIPFTGNNIAALLSGKGGLGRVRSRRESDHDPDDAGAGAIHRCEGPLL